jgi:Protein of unknown function (DUF3306)
MSLDGGFLARWSLRKAKLRSGGHVDPAAVAPQTAAAPAEGEPGSDPRAGVQAGVAARAPVPATGRAATSVVPVVAAEAGLPTLADVGALSSTSDYSRFVLPGVERAVSNAAMRKLFSDPHFNVMDGLDTYIDDYGKPDPIPESMLRRMNQALSLGLFEADPASEVDDRVAASEPAPSPSEAVSAEACQSQELPERPQPPAPEVQ